MSLPKLIAALEGSPTLPAGSEERFNGYGVMGLPFESGHVLAMRRFPASSIGSGYSSVWHRAPDGRWTFYTDVAPHRACTRYFGLAAAAALQTPVTIRWPGPLRLEVSVPTARLEWEIELRETAATRFMNGTARLLPTAAWQKRSVRPGSGIVAGPDVRGGGVGVFGPVPNGQAFAANPSALWVVARTRAVVAGQDLGSPGPVRPQAHLGDFWIPQRGIFALGRAFFDPFDPRRHSSSMTGMASA